MDAEGNPFTFELLLIQPSMEKLALPFQKNLQRLGIHMSIRTVDSAPVPGSRRQFRL